MAAAQGVRAQVFSRRLALIAGGQLALFGVLLGRLYQLQVLQRDRYTTLAEDNRVAMRLLAPSRGRILDRYGVPLALNRQNYRLVITAEQTGNVTAALDALAAIVTITDNDRRRVTREVARRRRFVPVTVREELSWDEVSRVAVNAPDLPGVAIEVGTSREYPYGVEFAHVLGYVAPPSEQDLTGDALLELPEMRIGRNGVERVYDVALRGRAGTSQLEVNAVGRPIRELQRLEGDPGLDVVLTIDLELQRVAAQALAEQQSGGAALIDVLNGDVLALVSTPGYDPSDFERGIPATDVAPAQHRRPPPAAQQGGGRRLQPGLDFQADRGAGGARGGHRARDGLRVPRTFPVRRPRVLLLEARRARRARDG